MVKAWYFNNIHNDHRDVCQGTNPNFIDIKELELKTGVLYWQVDWVTWNQSIN